MRNDFNTNLFDIDKEKVIKKANQKLEELNMFKLEVTNAKK